MATAVEFLRPGTSPLRPRESMEIGSGEGFKLKKRSIIH